MNSLLLPALYLGGCIAAMSMFSYIYRRLTSKVPLLQPPTPSQSVLFADANAANPH